MRLRIPEIVLAESTNLGAVTRAIAYAGFLWWFTWLQIVIRSFYGVPYLCDPTAALSLYERVDGYPFSVPQFLLGLSIGASLLSILGVWITSRNTPGTWRQRLLVVFFGSVCCGIAWLPFAWEPLFIESARIQRQFLMEHPNMVYPDDTPYEIRSREWQHLDEALERAEERNQRQQEQERLRRGE